MKKLVVVLAALALLATAVPVFAEVELGASWMPLSDADVPEGSPGGGQAIIAFHAGVNMLFLYATVDSLALPPSTVQDLTTHHDPFTETVTPGFNAPGFLNLFDVGVRLPFGPFIASVEVGTNNLYVYRIGMLGDAFGANLRLGLGVRFDNIGLVASGTAVFGSMGEMKAVLGSLRNEATRGQAIDQIRERLIPAIGITLYF